MKKEYLYIVGICLLIAVAAYFKEEPAFSASEVNKFYESSVYTASGKDTLIVKDEFYLEVKTKVEVGKNLNNALVTVEMDGKRVARFNTDKSNGKVNFKLPFDHNFKVTISKQGYYTKYITLDSNVPKKYKKEKYFFDLTIDLMKETKGLDASVLDKPIAEILFNAKYEGFMFDQVYTDQMKELTKKLKADYDFLQKIEDDIKKDSIAEIKKKPK